MSLRPLLKVPSLLLKPPLTFPCQQYAPSPLSLHSRVHHQPRRLTYPPLPSGHIPIPPLPGLLPHLQRHLPIWRLHLTIFDAFCSNTQPLFAFIPTMYQSLGLNNASPV